VDRSAGHRPRQHLAAPAVVLRRRPGRLAEQVTPEDAAQAHRDAWHPSTFTDHGMRGASQTWPYRPDLHVLVRAPDGTLAATTIIWLDERNGTAEFEPVGTHQG
jgi:hypothetical protein